MKYSLSLCGLAALAAQCTCQDLPPVTTEELQALISLDDLVAGAEQLQAFADADPDGNRAFGGEGHNATVDYLFDTLNATGYYNVTRQEFVELFSAASGSLTIDDEEIEIGFFTYTPSGNASAPLVAVAELGCSSDDFPENSTDAIVLISRGECTFAEKASNALTAGAVGAIIYNNIEDQIASGTLGGVGDYVPVVGITLEDGESFLALLEAGTNVTAELEVSAILENRTTFNVIAETLGGDHDNVIAAGAHTDSVFEGPGINDDGSGTIGILTTALALTNFTVTNAVRWCFWSAEEFGLLGSTYYVSQLNQTASEIAKIRAYLNFDMIASPNYYLAIYDGDGSTFNLSGPPGSAEIEWDFQAFYLDQGVNYSASAFDGRSDYGPFLENNIPAGGLFTGAEDLKTEEEELAYGGTAGEAYDDNYHKVGDNITNLDLDAWFLNTKSIANSIALYATGGGLDRFPPVTAPSVKRHWQPSVRKAKRAVAHQGHSHCGSEDLAI
ncbi:hypothetical protein B0A52_04795 [Exophiala mesophila]|uniref:Peptide hydrolase n=1 Tax=Exophiala mesophila TaxID=212818 RepID=A0A438N6N9_EXOME|nr:hypothetical protein B0A52_04795 [Exophiala mesophila]